ncbi:hypothetical protein TTHERM_00835300 (macronuclear) [Tetrahymena thermophila SB210]|uniref:Uncharacterized protein n=1 Tax=Tetrahymena thermophila (strain SB210) TaxID=312017 RepID=Q22E98_TETTS|nr:hypothetical protein TTHERM_00835300 [Tetrahymena thermophila SB210]EAR83630.1 hypothetical protein TTHERM_00835300 [Tetrahymena thermophila SB210]|eukprot:XP_001031293.1 hypothetical protein TTHERM_00835300 [Tetrahymena thermophila SB210]
MINRQQLMQAELEQLIIQNQQKDELLMMLMALNKQNLVNSDTQYHHLLQNAQQQQQLSQNNFYGLPPQQNSLFNNNNNISSHYGFNNQINAQSVSNHLNLGMLNQNQYQNPLLSLNNMYSQNQLNAKNPNSLYSNANTSRLSNMSNATTASSHSYLNNPTSETNLVFPECNFSRFSDFSQAKYIRDSETKKNLDLSDFSMQLEDSTTRASMNRNHVPLNQSQSPLLAASQFGYDKTVQQTFSQNELPKFQQQYYFSKQEEDADNTQKIQINDIRSSLEQPKLSHKNSNSSCGYKFISKDNSNNFMSKMKKNPAVSRIADTLTYIYTYEPQKLEQGEILEQLFFNNEQQVEQQSTKNSNKSEIICNSSPINTTIIQLNNKNCDDPLGNLTHPFEDNNKQNNEVAGAGKNKNYISKNSVKIEENLNFNTQFLSKSINLLSQQNGNKNTPNQDSDSINSDYFDEETEGEYNNFHGFIKKGHSSLRLNLKLVNTIENFLKKQLLFSNNPSKDEENNEKQEQTQKSVPISEKIKTMKGQLDFEDITNHISLETNVNEEVLKKEIQQILHSFKSNHKVYFKKVRSQKEMLKDTKFHNLNKRIMRVLLSILNNPIILQLKVPQPIFKFFHTMSTKLVNSSKKLIKNTIVNDQYSHAHYNTMFLQISASNYQKLSQSQSDIELHKIIYDIDLSLPYSQNYFEIQKTNILKQYIYLILDRTLRLNDTSNDSQIQAIRSMYIDRVIKGMEKMNAGKIVQRF